MGHPDDSIQLIQKIAADPEAVWAQFADPQRLARWWPQVTRFELRLGGRFEERWADDRARMVITRGTVAEFIPAKSVTLTWADEGWPAETVLRIRLAKVKDGTRLELEHLGWEGIPVRMRPDLIQSHAQGWAHHLEQLRKAAEAAE